MKKWIALILVTILITTALAGCGSTANTAPSAATKTSDKITLKFATTDEDSGIDHEITQTFKKRLGELSKGTMDVDLFMAGQMGDEKQALELLKLGELDVGYNAIMGDLYYKDMYAIAIPFLFPDVDSMDRYMASPTGDKIKKILMEKGGVQYAGMFDFGPRYFTSNKPFKTPEEMKGIKIRLPQIQSWIDVFKQIGASPTPIAATEIVTALKTGTVDGQENFLSNIAGRQMWEYQKYLIATKHVMLPQTWLISDKTLKKLNEQQRQWLSQAINDAIKDIRSKTTTMNQEFIKKATDNKMTLIEPDRAAFVKAAQPAVDKVLSQMAPGVAEDAKKAIAGK
ncbi:MAG: TRAP transporter substrate-binding protein [Desulfitobacteriaceae bacterium]|nr:TRAP transporter substrate-binding protein [Desulfitobacteriaceae bacterium]MDI6879077.1 TRAP transporter substrate-binding protein [Desulfitobacteriaceae bacterium]MDI6913882.1 TRAP transporter substrate-binding protein [Desulfitobacteriaceae bacterium]